MSKVFSLVLRTCVALLVLELIARMLFSSPPPPPPPELPFYPDGEQESFTSLPKKPHDLLGTVNRPNSIGPYKINSKGLRGPETAYSKPEDTYRILVLGDSVGFGVLVTEEETFPHILGEMLGSRVDVLNAASGGYDTAQELIFLKIEGYKYRPDMVVLQFCWNDIPILFRSFKASSYAPDSDYIELAGVPIPEWLPRVWASAIREDTPKGLQAFRINLHDYLGHHFRLYHCYNQFFEKFVKRDPVYLVDYNLRLFGMMKQYCDSIGAKLVVALAPARKAVSYAGTLITPQERFAQPILEFLNKEQVPCVFPVKEMNDDMFADNCHFNGKGNRIFAEKVYQCVMHYYPRLKKTVESSKKG